MQRALDNSRIMLTSLQIIRTPWKFGLKSLIITHRHSFALMLLITLLSASPSVWLFWQLKRSCRSKQEKTKLDVVHPFHVLSWIRSTKVHGEGIFLLQVETEKSKSEQLLPRPNGQTWQQIKGAGIIKGKNKIKM